MRDRDEIKQLVLNIAENDGRIRAVLLNGSRANRRIAPDKYQDFDIVFIVNSLESFISDHNWISIFGERLISQLPDEMILECDEEKNNNPDFHYLMLFKDGNRIDLTLFPLDKVKEFHPQSLTMVWVDKDNLFAKLGEANESDHLIKRPDENQFLDTCNEFWWVSTYVAKGLLRREITYSKEMLERHVRPMFMRIVEWYIGITTEFSVSFGKGGRFINKYLSEAVYDRILKTYSDSHAENNWKALFIMMELFSQLALAIAVKLGFRYNKDEEKNVTTYLEELYREQD